MEIVELSGSSPKKRSISSTKEMCLSEILDLCKYDIVEEERDLGETELFARFEWGKVVSYVNSSYAMSSTVKELKSKIRHFGGKGRISVRELKRSLGDFIKAYQISLVVEGCQIHNSTSLNEEDIDWDMLISRISAIYGVSMTKWQLFHPGKNKSEDVLNRIKDRILFSGDYENDCIFTASVFKKLMI